MFNFMLVVLGIFAAGVVNALDKTPNIVTAFLCFFAAGLAVVFTFLDRRNRDLVWLGEDVLTHLERKAIFGEGRTGDQFVMLCVMLWVLMLGVALAVTPG